MPLTSPYANISGSSILAGATTDASTGVLSAVLALANAPLLGPGMIAAAQFNDFSAGLGDRFQFSGERYVTDYEGKRWHTTVAIPEGARITENLCEHPSDLTQSGWALLKGATPVGTTGVTLVNSNSEIRYRRLGQNPKGYFVITFDVYGDSTLLEPEFVDSADGSNSIVKQITVTAEPKRHAIVADMRGVSSFSGNVGFFTNRLNSVVTPGSEVHIENVRFDDLVGAINKEPPEPGDGLQWYMTTNPNRTENGVVVSDVPQVELPARMYRNELPDTASDLSTWVLTGGAAAPVANGDGSYRVALDQGQGVYVLGTASYSTGDKFAHSLNITPVSGVATVRLDDPSGYSGAKIVTVSNANRYGRRGVVSGDFKGIGIWIRNVSGTPFTIDVSMPMQEAADELPDGMLSAYVKSFGYSAYEHDAVVDANGVVTPQQGPRITVVQGIRLGGPQENLFAAPNDLSDPAWTRPRLDVAVDDGWQTLTPTTETGAHFAYQDSSIAGSAKYTLSAEAIPNGYDWVQITGSTGFETKWANINVRTGEIGEASASLGTANVRAELQDDGSCLVVYTDESHTSPDPAAVNRLLFSVLDSDRAARIPSYAGDGASGVKVRNLKFAKKAYYDGYNEGVTPPSTMQQLLSAPLRNKCKARIVCYPLFASADDKSYVHLFEARINAANRFNVYATGDQGRLYFERKAQGVTTYSFITVPHDRLDKLEIVLSILSDRITISVQVNDTGVIAGEVAGALMDMADGPMTVHVGQRGDGTLQADMVVGEFDLADPDGHIINALSQPIDAAGVQSGLNFIKPANDDYQVMLSDGASVVSALAQVVQAASQNNFIKDLQQPFVRDFVRDFA